MPLATLDQVRMKDDPLLEHFPDDLRQPVLMLVQALATIKHRQAQLARLFNTWPLPMMTTFKLAQVSARADAQELLGQASRAGGPVPWFQVMVRVDCPKPDCLAGIEYLVCPSCERTLFTLTTSDSGEHLLACANPNCRGRWVGGFPLQTQCEQEHPIKLDWDEWMGQRLELFVGKKLAFLMQKLLADEAKVYHFDASSESLWVRDDALVHQYARPDYVVRQAGDMVIVKTGGGAYIGGSLEVHGDFTGRDRIVTDLFTLAQHEAREVTPSRGERKKLESAVQAIQDQVIRGKKADRQEVEELLGLLAGQDHRVVALVLAAVLHPVTQAAPAVKTLAENVLTQAEG